MSQVRGTSQVAYQSGTYPGFRSMKRLGVFLLPPGWDVSPSQGYPPELISPVPIYTPGWREALWEFKCLAREHNAMSPARGPFLEGPETFSHPKTRSKILNRGSLHSRRFSRTHHSVFRYRSSWKMVLRVRKVSRAWGHRASHDGTTDGTTLYFCLISEVKFCFNHDHYWLYVLRICFVAFCLMCFAFLSILNPVYMNSEPLYLTPYVKKLKEVYFNICSNVVL